MSQKFLFVGYTSVGSEIAHSLLEAGFKAAERIEDADVILTYTPFMDDTEEVYFGGEGMIALAKPGAYLVNLSPASPTLAQEISALAQISSMHAVDAPLFVRDAGREHAFADKDNLCAFVGGSEDDIAAVLGLLEAVSGEVVSCGGAGSGQLAKAAATLQRTAAVVGIVEADALCRFSGNDEVSARIMARSFAAGAAAGELANYYGALVGRRLSGSYTAEIMLGELVAALNTADDEQLILPQAESAEYLLELLCAIGGAGMAPAALALVYSDEDEGAAHGLNWDRADEFFDQIESYDYDDEDDYGFGHGHGHDHGHDHGHGHGHDHGRGHGSGGQDLDDDDFFGFN